MSNSVDAITCLRTEAIYAWREEWTQPLKNLKRFSLAHLQYFLGMAHRKIQPGSESKEENKERHPRRLPP